MIKPDDIRQLRTASSDYTETEALKAELRKRRGERKPYFLTGDELDRIFHWKLRSQYGRTQHLLARNSDAAYRAVTEAVFKIAGPDNDYETRVRLALLCALPGVGVPVASAVLALTDPERYCVIDFRGWRTLFDEERASFTIGDFLRYRAKVAQIATALGWSVQETDLAIWEYDNRRGSRESA
jgi:hypothetical protein